MLEMIAAFSKAAGKPILHAVQTASVGDIAECWSSPDKSSRDMQWRAVRTVDDMAQDAPALAEAGPGRLRRPTKDETGNATEDNHR